MRGGDGFIYFIYVGVTREASDGVTWAALSYADIFEGKIYFYGDKSGEKVHVALKYHLNPRICEK